MGRDEHGRSKSYVQCWNCGGWVGEGLLDEDHYDNECPLCHATGLIEVG